MTKQLTLLLSLAITFALPQSFPVAAADADINHIPADPTEAVKLLKSTLSKSVLDKIRSGKESIAIELQPTLGMGIRNDWIRGKNMSPLRQYFSKKGVNNPDDDSEIILVSLWRDLHNQPIRLEEQINAKVDRELAVVAAVAPQMKKETTISDSIWNSVLNLSTGKSSPLASFKGKVIVLAIFWADDASSAEASVLNDLFQKLPQKDLQIIGLFSGGNPAQYSDFTQKTHPKFPMVADARPIIRELTKQVLPGMLIVPCTLIISKKGGLVARYNDWYQSSPKLITDTVTKAVKE